MTDKTYPMSMYVNSEHRDIAILKDKILELEKQADNLAKVREFVEAKADCYSMQEARCAEEILDYIDSLSGGDS